MKSWGTTKLHQATFFSPYPTLPWNTKANGSIPLLVSDPIQHNLLKYQNKFDYYSNSSRYLHYMLYEYSVWIPHTVRSMLNASEQNKEETNKYPTEVVKLTTGIYTDIHTRVIQHCTIRTETAFHLFNWSFILCTVWDKMFRRKPLLSQAHRGRLSWITINWKYRCK